MVQSIKTIPGPKSNRDLFYRLWYSLICDPDIADRIDHVLVFGLGIRNEFVYKISSIKRHSDFQTVGRDMERNKNKLIRQMVYDSYFSNDTYS